MEAEAAKYIGAGLACLGMAGTALGLGNIFGSYLSGALRNPSAADSQFGRLCGRLRRYGSSGHLLAARSSASPLSPSNTGLKAGPRFQVAARIFSECTWR